MFPFKTKRLDLQLRRLAHVAIRKTSYATSPAASKGPTAVVLLNMGGPATQNEVGDFLLRLFVSSTNSHDPDTAISHPLTTSLQLQSDSDLIPLGRFQPYLASLISRLRTPKIQKQYATIGGGSPIRKWSEYQAQEICEILDQTSSDTAPHILYVAFRYARPLTEDTYVKLLEDGFGECGRVVAFSQYPQFSCCTTGSYLNELWRLREGLEGGDVVRRGIQWSVIDRWPTNKGFVEAFAGNILQKLGEFPEERRRDVTVVFSAHSQPMSYVNKGMFVLSG